jgi:hypothetical protein
VNNRGSYLVFACIKGHSSIRGNEEVVRAAKLADRFPEIMSTRPWVLHKKGKKSTPIKCGKGSGHRQKQPPVSSI